MNLGTAEIGVAHGGAIPSLFADIPDCPNDIEIFARIEIASIGRRNRAYLTGISIGAGALSHCRNNQLSGSKE